MESYLLRYFIAVVEAGSFTRAAERSFVTQPTLSAGIKRLEDQLGTKLFERSNKRVFLTDAGNRLLPHARAILHETNRAEESVADADRPVLRVGLVSTLATDLVGRVMRRFRQEQGDTVLELTDGTEQEIQNRLSERSIDVALTLDRGLISNAIPLYSERYVFILAADHPLASRKRISSEDLSEEPMIVRSRCELLSETSRYFTDQNRRPRLAYRTSNDARAVAMVEAGLGGTIVPKSMVTPRVSEHRLTGFDHSRKIVSITAERAFTQAQSDLIARWNSIVSIYFTS